MAPSPARRAATARRILKPALFLALSAPLAWLCWAWFSLIAGTGGAALGFNPIEYSIRFTGEQALRALLLALAVTPLARLTGWRPLMSVRRMTGLFAFAYVVVHLSLYLGADLEFSLAALVRDVGKRIYITAGMAAFLLLLPLAITSTSGWIKRLGARRWQRLHRLVYAASVLAVLHFIFMVKGNQSEPWIYAAVLGILLGSRLVLRWQDAKRRQPNRSAVPAGQQ